MEPTLSQLLLQQQGMSMQPQLAFGQNKDMYGRSLNPQMSYGQTFDSNNAFAGGQFGQANNIPGQESAFGGIGLDQIGAGMSIAKDLYGLYQGNQAMNLAKDQFGMQKQAYNDNKDRKNAFINQTNQAFA